jgi:hypothetical protein
MKRNIPFCAQETAVSLDSIITHMHKLLPNVLRKVSTEIRPDKVVPILNYKQYAMKTNGGVDVQIHVLLTSALVGGQWSASRPGRFTPRERDPGRHWIGGWVDPTAALDDM